MISYAIFQRVNKRFHKIVSTVLKKNTIYQQSRWYQQITEFMEKWRQWKREFLKKL